MMRAVVEARAHRYLMLNTPEGRARRDLRRHRLPLAERAAARRAGHGRRARARARPPRSGGCCRELEAVGASSILVVPGRADDAMSIVAEIKRDGEDAVRRWALELDGVEPAPAVAGARAAAARGAARARRPRAALARGAAARRRRRSRSSRACCSSGAGCRSRTVGVYVPAEPRLDAGHVRRPGAGGGRRADRRLHAAGRRRARRRGRRGARHRRGVGARRAAGDRLARLRPQGRQDRRARERLRERGEARGAARRRDRPARRPVRGRRRRRRRRRPAARRARARRAGRARRRHASAASSRRSRRPRRSRPSTSCCSARPRRSPTQVRNAGAVFVGPSSPVAAGDYATGGNHVLPTSGWARSVGGLGIETFLKPVTTQRLTAEGLALHPADGRGARRGRGHARARGGGAAMKALAPEFRAYTWAPPNDEVARLAGHRPLAGRPLRPEHPAAAAAVDAARHDRRRARRDQQLPGRAATSSCAGRSPTTTASSPTSRARRRRRRPDPALRPLLRRARRHDRDPGAADVPALPDRRAARRRRGRRRTRPGVAHVHVPAEQPDGRAAAAARRRGRSSSTRRTSSTAARRRCRCSTTA